MAGRKCDRGKDRIWIFCIHVIHKLTRTSLCFSMKKKSISTFIPLGLDVDHVHFNHDLTSWKAFQTIFYTIPYARLILISVIANIYQKYFLYLSNLTLRRVF